MPNQSKSAEVEIISCQVCNKEVPLSEAKVSEAADYVAHFCGLECYAEWKRNSAREGHKDNS